MYYPHSTPLGWQTGWKISWGGWVWFVCCVWLLLLFCFQRTLEVFFEKFKILPQGVIVKLKF